MVDTLDHLPPLPLSVHYVHTMRGITVLTEQDELGLCHALRLHDRVLHVDITLPPSILHKVLVLMDQHFPILERLSLSSPAQNSIPLTLPKAFLAPNLRSLTLPGISPPKRLQLLTTTVSLVTLKLGNIETSSYFRPRVLVARLRSLPQLQELSIGFSIPIPRPSTEREMLGGQGAPATLPNLKNLQFKGVTTYLESLVAQIRAPLLAQLEITLFNQITFALPHLFHLINITEAFKLPESGVHFDYNNVFVTTSHLRAEWFEVPFRLRVKCKPLDWQIDCAAQICRALIPVVSGAEELVLYSNKIQTELQSGGIDSTTWHDLLRSFNVAKVLFIPPGLIEELARALQADEVGSDPGFLPNLQSIYAASDLFTSFIDARQAVGRPVQFVQLGPWPQYGLQQALTNVSAATT
jgi:hypothetical protein